MSRTGKFTKRIPEPDPVYKSRLVAKIINKAMFDGKKSVAQKQIYTALEMIKSATGQDPLAVLRKAIENIKPQMEVRARRIGGAAYQVPMPVRGERKESLAIRWLIEFANKRPNKDYHTFADKLSAEIQEAFNEEGLAIRKRDMTHRMAEANKAFAHFRW